MPNRNAVFIDTSGWVAVLNTDDGLYELACRQLADMGRDRRPLITTDWVLAETGNCLARSTNRSSFSAAVRRFSESSHCQLVRVDAALFDRALNMYANVGDKSWGLVDCASFVVMQDRSLLDAFTSDRHFVQAGFRCLLSTT
jgi:uncharacterized protein